MESSIFLLIALLLIESNNFSVYLSHQVFVGYQQLRKYVRIQSHDALMKGIMCPEKCNFTTMDNSRPIIAWSIWHRLLFGEENTLNVSYSFPFNLMACDVFLLLFSLPPELVWIMVSMLLTISNTWKMFVCFFILFVPYLRVSAINS